MWSDWLARRSRTFHPSSTLAHGKFARSRGGKLAILVANFAVGTTDGATWRSAAKCDSRWSKGLARYLRQSGKLCMLLGRPERKYHIICKK